MADKPKKKMGRPLKVLDFKMLDGLLKIHCTQEEIASIVCMEPSAINDKVKAEFGITFQEYAKEKRSMGKMSLRRAMFTNATNKNNSTMQIWLSKQHLGMSENPVGDDICDGLDWEFEPNANGKT